MVQGTEGSGLKEPLASSVPALGWPSAVVSVCFTLLSQRAGTLRFLRHAGVQGRQGIAQAHSSENGCRGEKMSQKNRAALVSLGERDPGGGQEKALAALEEVQFSAPRWRPQPPLSLLADCGLL